MTTYTFEKREGNPGYVWATGRDNSRFEIYLQYASVTPIPSKIESKLDLKTFKIQDVVVEEYPVVELSPEEKADLVAQARAFDAAPATIAEASTPIAAEAIQLPANVQALVAKYGSSQAAWEAEDESACFQLRAYNY